MNIIDILNLFKRQKSFADRLRENANPNGINNLSSMQGSAYMNPGILDMINRAMANSGTPNPSYQSTRPPLASHNQGDYPIGTNQNPQHPNQGINNLSSIQSSNYMNPGILNTINQAIAGPDFTKPQFIGTGNMQLPQAQQTTGMTPEQIRLKYFDIKSPAVQTEFKKNPTYQQGLMDLYRNNIMF